MLYVSWYFVLFFCRWHWLLPRRVSRGRVWCYFPKFITTHCTLLSHHLPRFWLHNCRHGKGAFNNYVDEIRGPQSFHVEVKVVVLNAISQSCNWKSDFFEVKLVPCASVCLENYLDQFLWNFKLTGGHFSRHNLTYCLLEIFKLIFPCLSYY